MNVARKITSIAFSLVLALMLSACASERMVDLTQPPASVAAPAVDSAIVVFLRPSILGGAIQSSVFDISGTSDELVGIVSSGRKIAYSTKPGKRRFMVIGESADFMDAELAAGRIYYARVEPRVGFWKARFSLVPVTAADASLAGDLSSCKWVDNTASSLAWARENMPSIREKHTSYLPDWEKSADKPFLPVTAGK